MPRGSPRNLDVSSRLPACHSTTHRMETQEQGRIKAFQSWFQGAGGWFHPELAFVQDATTGLSLVATSAIEADTTVVRMPRSLGLTPAICRGKILSAVGSSQGPEFASANEWVVFYLFLVKVCVGSGSDDGPLSTHWPYIDVLPTDVLTPPHYTPAEVDLLRATPLHGDAIERRSKYFASFSTAVQWLKSQSSPSNVTANLLSRLRTTHDDHGSGEEELLSPPENQPLFEMWIWAQTAYSSRAFPPKMLCDDNLSLTGPVLLPGVDAFNHARGVPVSWVYPYAEDTTTNSSDADTVSLTMHYAIAQGQQVFNNYGAKSNEEFLAGYGFVLEPALDDTLTLVLGGGQRRDDDNDDARDIDSHTTALAIAKPWGGKHYWRIRQQPQHPARHSLLHPSSENSTSTGGGPPAGLLIELYERIQSTTTTEDPSISDSWLLKAYQATPTPTPSGSATPIQVSSSITRNSRVHYRHHSLAALKLDGEVLETLEELLCAKRKAFKVVQRHVDATRGNDGDHVRPSVRRNIDIYRRGQATILDEAIEWTRCKMDELVEMIDEVEEERG